MISRTSFGAMVQGTAISTTSGTSHEFAGIPSWAKKITVMFDGLSANGTSHLLIQFGVGTYVSSGYTSSSQYLQGGSTSGNISSTAGFVLYTGNSANIISGSAVLNRLSGNTWVMTSNFVFDSNPIVAGFSAGKVALGGVADRIRIATSNGTDQFDNGTINILYEGS